MLTVALIYKRHVPQNVGELLDHLTYIMFSGPAFEDPHFVGRDLEAAFFELNEALRLMRKKLGEDRFSKLTELSDRVRAHYEADPEKTTGDTLKGRELIIEMEKLLKKKS